MEPQVIYCSMIGVFGLALCIVIYLFGKRLFDQKTLGENILEQIIKLEDPKTNADNLKEIGESSLETFSEHLQKRNEYWFQFGQIIIAILIVTLISILLVLRVISAEAGLPILSGITGYAMAKGASSSKLLEKKPQ